MANLTLATGAADPLPLVNRGLDGQTSSDRLGTERRLAALYLDLKSELVRRGFAREIDDQHDAPSALLTESRFLREAAWAIVSGGMSERTVRSHFGELSEAFLNWVSASDIVINEARCRCLALRAWNHPGKIDAVIGVCRFVADRGFLAVAHELSRDPVATLMNLDYLGPATARHLAKNLGCPVAKPDRHLRRISAALGFDSPQALCDAIARLLDEPVGVVDLVFWRYATTRKAYVSEIRDWTTLAPGIYERCSSRSWKSRA